MAYLTLETGEFRRTFHSRGDLEDWWQSEKEAWSWLAEAPDDRFTDVIAKFRNVDAVFAEPEGKEHIARALKALFHPSHLGPRPSQSDEGMRILDAYQLTGRTPAMQFMLLDMAPSQINWRGDPVGVAAALKAASAAYALAKLDKAVFNSERRAYREGLGRIESKFQKLEADQRAGYASRRKAYRLAARKLFERSRKLWNDGQSKMYTENWEAVSSIQETEQRYKVQMALAAPVQYWKDKAKSHGSWEVAWGLITLAYFALSAWAIYEIAIWSADYLLGLSNADQSLRTPVYIVVSGAVLGVTTLIFWAGRLFSKLYLSEHHLKSECLEKAVMTQAFLSMETREDFSPEERAVVLASIFRSSADGMVKDDGPGDIGLPLLLSRIVSKS